GVVGAVLVVGSLVLVTYNTQHESLQRAWSFQTTLAAFSAGLVGAVVSALVLASYLPQIPYVNRLILKPQADRDEEPGEEGVASPAPALAALLGSVGVAVSPLRPAGKVQFGTNLVDVVAEGGYVEPGMHVQVVEIEGNRVVVKEVEPIVDDV